MDKGGNKEQKRQFQQTNKFAQDSPTYTSTGRLTRLLSQTQFHSHQIQDPYPKTAQTVSTEDVSAAPDCWGRLPRLPIVKPPGLWPLPSTQWEFPTKFRWGPQVPPNGGGQSSFRGLSQLNLSIRGCLCLSGRGWSWWNLQLLGYEAGHPLRGQRTLETKEVTRRGLFSS
jgi:hypothetical protein